MTYLTPYQGTKVTFGYYECICKNEWRSGFSWANTSQGCKNCGINVYPYKQHPHSKKTIKNKKAHIQNLCGKCCYSKKSCSEK